VLEGAQEILIQHLGLLIAGRLGFHLLFEPAALVERIVELGEGVADFPARDKGFEAFDQFGVIAVAFGQG